MKRDFHNRMFRAREKKRILEKKLKLQTQQNRWDFWMRSPNGVPAKLGDFMRRVKRQPNYRCDLFDENEEVISSVEGIKLEMHKFVKNIFLNRYWETEKPDACHIDPRLHSIVTFTDNEFLMSDITVQEVVRALKFLKLGT